MTKRPAPFPTLGRAASYRNDLVTVRHDEPRLDRATDGYAYPCGHRVATTNELQEADAREGKRHTQAYGYPERVNCVGCLAARGGGR